MRRYLLINGVRHKIRTFLKLTIILAINTRQPVSFQGINNLIVVLSSFHPFPLIASLRTGWPGCWSLSQLSSRFLVARLTFTDRQPHTHTHTHLNPAILKSPINLICICSLDCVRKPENPWRNIQNIQDPCRERPRPYQETQDFLAVTAALQ